MHSVSTKEYCSRLINVTVKIMTFPVFIFTMKFVNCVSEACSWFHTILTLHIYIHMILTLLLKLILTLAIKTVVHTHSQMAEEHALHNKHY